MSYLEGKFNEIGTLMYSEDCNDNTKALNSDCDHFNVADRALISTSRPEISSICNNYKNFDCMSEDIKNSMKPQDAMERCGIDRRTVERRKNRALYGASMIPNKSKKHLTIPIGFHFAIDMRLKCRYLKLMSRGINNDGDDCGVHSKVLDNTNCAMRLTKIKPFNFELDKRLNLFRNKSMKCEVVRKTPLAEKIRKLNMATPEYWKFGDRFGKFRTSISLNDLRRITPKRLQSSPFVPMHEKIRKIENTTPDHWKDQPLSHRNNLQLTRPVGPRLLTTLRSKAKLLSAVKKSPQDKYQFKAHPLDYKILKCAGELGILRVKKRPLTQPKSPNLRVTLRAKLRSLKVQNDEKRQGTRFEKANLKKKSSFLTVPKSPFLHTKLRSCMRVDMNEMDLLGKKDRSLMLRGVNMLEIAENDGKSGRKYREVKIDGVEYNGDIGDGSTLNGRDEFDANVAFGKMLETRSMQSKSVNLENVGLVGIQREQQRDLKSKTTNLQNQSQSIIPLKPIDDFALNRGKGGRYMGLKGDILNGNNRYRSTIKRESMKVKDMDEYGRRGYKAISVPSSLYNPPKSINPSNKPLTIPRTPNFVKRISKLVSTTHVGRDL